MNSRCFLGLIGVATSLLLQARSTGSEAWLVRYQGIPYDSAAIAVPGNVQCEFYDRGGEGVAFHDSDGVNSGSGRLNPLNGSPLNAFRVEEAVDISYTKSTGIDDNPCNRYEPPIGSLYVGWTAVGEWLNYTVDVKEAGSYTVSIPYTANGDGSISLALDGDQPLATVAIPSTSDPKDPLVWRQAHHWAFLPDAATVTLPAGRHVLTVKIETNGHLNLDTLAFRPAGEPAPTVTVPTPPAAWTPVDGANHPFGIARGAQPGRVVWTHDAAAATWDGQTGFWWEDRFNDQAAVDRMVAAGIRQLAAAHTEAAAYEALFRSFNQRLGRGDVGYRKGEKIAIKINENNTSGHGPNNNNINASPDLVLALLKSLVNGAGVPEEDITVFDASRFITGDIFDKSHAVFPGVRFVDNVGGDGRIKTTYVANAIPFSIDTGLQTGLASCLVEATYVVNMALLKGHNGQGVTLCGKNWFGSTSIQSDWKKNFHAYFNQLRDGSPSYMAFIDYMGHKDMGAKTFLFLIDALYANDTVGGTPHLRWKMAPFNGTWPSSVLLSQDGVAIDSVAIDFVRTEWPGIVDLAYGDNYLHEAARADASPSGTVYDPERDGTTLPSLGAHEHWNNPTDKQYSRNLGTGDGIELLYVPTGAN